MYATSELVSQRHKVRLEEARQTRHALQIRALRKAVRMERRAERRMLRAWQVAADIRRELEAGS